MSSFVDSFSSGSSGNTTGSFTILSPFAKPSTGGALDTVMVETSTNHVTYFVDEFVSASKTHGWGKTAMPANWNGSTIQARFFFDSTSAGTGNVILGIGGTCYGNGSTIDVATGTAQEVTTTYQGSGKMNISGLTSAITLGGTPAAGNLCLFDIYRASTDTLAATIRILAVQIVYTIG